MLKKDHPHDKRQIQGLKAVNLPKRALAKSDHDFDKVCLAQQQQGPVAYAQEKAQSSEPTASKRRDLAQDAQPFRPCDGQAHSRHPDRRSHTKNG